MAKTKALISFEVTAKLICVFVFEYADRLFSHEAAHFICVRFSIHAYVTFMHTVAAFRLNAQNDSHDITGFVKNLLIKLH